MKKITLIFLAISLLLIFFTDIEITTVYPFLELSRMITGGVTPKLSVLFEFYPYIINTLSFAFIGLFVSILFALILFPFYHFRIINLFCSIIRSVHEIFWAFLLLPVLGLTPLCGIFAIAIPYAGILAKGFSEILDEADLRVYKSLPQKTNPVSAFFYTVLPVVYEEVKHFTHYRLECALKSSAILGFIGLPTIGFYMESFFRKGMYSEAFALLYIFFILIALLKYLVKDKIVPFYVIASFLVISKSVSFRWENFVHFLTYEIVPWPMRREGFLDGTNRLVFNLTDTWSWLKKISLQEGLTGVFNTVILTQVAFVITGIITLILLYYVSRHFNGTTIQRLSKGWLIILRTTPEYMIAYIFVQIMGPSMLPGILALAIHNGAVVAFLTLKSCNQIKLPIDRSNNKLNLYFYEVLPRIYGNFLANLFYRWEVMIRESALLGILGIYTIGFYIDSAISDDRMDKTIILIIHMIILNSIVNFLSGFIRKKIRQEDKLR